MIIEIEQPHAGEMLKRFPDLTGLGEQLRLGNRIQVPLARLSQTELAALADLYQAAGAAGQVQAARLSAIRDALDAGGPRFEGEDLEHLVPALVRHLTKDGIRGWLFTAPGAGRPLPYLVSRIDYTPASNDEAGRVLIEIKANAKGGLAGTTLRLSASDVAGKTVAEILLAKGFVRESPALIATYDENAARYFDWRARYGEQFTGRGTGFYADDPNATHRNTDWSRKDIIVLATGESPARLVNDESILANRTLILDASGDILGPYLRKAAKSNEFDAETDASEAAEAVAGGLFTTLPIHPFLFMFHLDLHHYLWVHVDDIAPYQYRPDLKDKLILPPEQTDLIDILTAEMDMLMDDIVAGKSGGTTVLCAGPPGVGKTLTAEVYSEIIRRPLYRVHSGQLGLNAAAMETALTDVLTRAQRWGAVMLIDEADVYIKRRQDDITMNAVVGVFLRVLEYFNGLLFLTTNRVDDIDEAIVSRCIALIRYEAPDDGARRRIWQVMSDQFDLAVDAPLIESLVETFPAASGRDIKGLAKLVAKFCHHKGLSPDLDAFKRCAIFRGLEQMR